jgi:hypothetical protein
MDKESRIFSDGAIAIRDDRIVDLGKSGELTKQYKAKKRLMERINSLSLDSTNNPGEVIFGEEVSGSFTEENLFPSTILQFFESLKLACSRQMLTRC